MGYTSSGGVFSHVVSSYCFFWGGGYLGAHTHTQTASFRKDMPFRELGNLMASNIGNLAIGNRNGNDSAKPEVFYSVHIF